MTEQQERDELQAKCNAFQKFCMPNESPEQAFERWHKETFLEGVSYQAIAKELQAKLDRSEAAGAEVLKLIEIGHINRGDVELVAIKAKRYVKALERIAKNISSDHAASIAREALAPNHE